MLPEQPVDERVAHRLWLAGALPAERYRQALALARDDGFWRRWGERAVLALASGHLLAAVLFFFAFNWQDLSPFAKLGSLQAALVLAALGSRLPMLPELAREALLLAATVLVGVTLAVFGQIFQTGADAWQLFAGWAALTLPWVLAGRSAGHWLVWLLVCSTGLALWLETHNLFREADMAFSLLLMSLPSMLFLAGLEPLRERFDWLRPAWARLVPLTAVLGLLFFGAEAAVFGAAAGWAGLVFVLAEAAAAGAYGHWRRDFAAVAVTVLLGCGFLATLTIKVTNLRDEVGTFFLASLEIALIFGAGSWLLRRLHRSWQEAAHA